MALPALDLLARRGYAPIVTGPAWCSELLAAYPWKVVVLTGSRADSIRALRRFRGAPALLLTNSFGSALDFRLAGVPAAGYARDARSWLLSQAFVANAGEHMVEYYYRLATLIAGAPTAAAPDPQLRLDADTQQRARDLFAAAGGAGGYVVLCPLAIGLHRGRVKAWEGFSRLGHELLESGLQVVAMPGPGETAGVRRVLPGAIVLPESDVATFAALLAGARLVVANDSGAGHLAAAAGAPLISVFGVTDPRQTRPRSSRATLLGSANGWPRYEDVRSAVDAALAF